MRIFLLLILLLKCNCLMAQECKLDLSYNYLYANQWDKAIQSYNYSRPFITEKQPLLIHGFNTSVSYILKSSKNCKQGITVSYAYSKSVAQNEDLENKLNLHILNLGYLLHYESNNTLKGTFADLILSAKSSGLFRKVNEEAFVYDEKTSKALGIGADLCFKLGHYYKFKKRIYLSPFISVAYTPYFYSPNTEALINQTKGITSKDWTTILTTQIGLTFYLKKRLTN